MLALMLACTGCEPLCYYAQAVRGQLSLSWDQRPIAEMLTDPQTPAALRQRLDLVVALRRFADRQLRLPVGGDFADYVALDRPHVLWLVFATPEFSLKPRTWCYPVAGCTPYRGYFDITDAQLFAAELGETGSDVYVCPADAYSTLGWFDDPILSTVIFLPPERLAGLIFHELAHRLLYVKNDSMFNESFATMVEREGVRRWLALSAGRQAVEKYRLQLEHAEAFHSLVARYRARLSALYASDLKPEGKRAAKKGLFQALKADYLALKKQWRGHGDYDGWFAHRLNNAQLISAATYNELVPAFERLLRGKGGNLEAFYRECRRLAREPKALRRKLLEGAGEIAQR